MEFVFGNHNFGQHTLIFDLFESCFGTLFDNTHSYVSPSCHVFDVFTIDAHASLVICLSSKIHVRDVLPPIADDLLEF